MKNKFLISIELIIYLIIIFTGCSSPTQSNKLYFSDKDSRGIIIPVSIGDSINANVHFDTGCSYGWALELDSLFCAQHSYAAWSSEPDYNVIQSLTGWNNFESTLYRIFDTPIDITIDNKKLQYSNVIVSGVKAQRMGCDGIIGFPTADSELTWEINFENNYLEIHNPEEFVAPRNCYWLPMIIDRTYSVYVEFPILFYCSDDTTVTIKYPFLIDTGILQDFVILRNAPELSFFEAKDDFVALDLSLKRYDVKAEMFEGFTIDSMRIYTDVESDKLCNIENAVIGINFLKRFNVFFNFSTKQVGFQPIANYSRIVNPNLRRIYYSSYFTPEGTEVIDTFIEMDDNPFRDAGIKEGDEIIAVNGIKINEITPEKAAILRNTPEKKLSIKRNDRDIEITVNLSVEAIAGE